MFQPTRLLSGSYDWREQPRGSTEDGSLQEDLTRGGEVTAALQTGGSEYSLSGEKLNLLGRSRRSFSQLTLVCMLWICDTSDHIRPPLAWQKQVRGENTRLSVSQQTNIFFFPPGRFCNFGVTPSPVTPILIVGTRLHSHQLQLNHTSIFDDGVSEAAILITRNRTQVASETLCRPGDAFKWIPFCVTIISGVLLSFPTAHVILH